MWRNVDEMLRFFFICATEVDGETLFKDYFLHLLMKKRKMMLIISKVDFSKQSSRDF